MIKNFVTLYSPAHGLAPWENITEIATKLGWTGLAAQTTSEFLDLQGVNRLWTREMVDAATRVNYGQVRNAAFVQVVVMSSILSDDCRTSTKSTR